MKDKYTIVQFSTADQKQHIRNMLDSLPGVSADSAAFHTLDGRKLFCWVELDRMELRIVRTNQYVEYVQVGWEYVGGNGGFGVPNRVTGPGEESVEDRDSRVSNSKEMNYGFF